MLIFTHIFFSHTGAQGEERSSCADGTVEPPLGVPARHPPTCRVAAAFAPHSAQSARTRACGVRACYIAAFLARLRALPANLRVALPFYLLLPRLRRSLQRAHAPDFDAISARCACAPAAAAPTHVLLAVIPRQSIERVALERAIAQKAFLPIPRQRGKKHPKCKEKFCYSLIVPSFGV